MSAYDDPTHWGTHVDEQRPPAQAISAVDAILFSLKIDDHFDRLQWLEHWSEGCWSEMHEAFPEFALNEWRKPGSPKVGMH